jgi:type I restriction enzyme S subunit
MRGWQIAPLETLYSEPSRNGLTRPKRVRGNGYPMINMGEIFAYERIGGIEMDRVPMSQREIEQFSVQPGDLLFARQSLVAAGAGKCSIVKAVGETTTFESHLIRVRLDGARCNPYFYFYYFLSPQGKATVQSLVMQVAAAGIRGSELAKLHVPLPTLPTQRRIAGILSAYDELIENSQRRIKILESMARALYREWFVHFRFPGHESISRVPSPLGELPQGWEVKRVDQICRSIQDGDWIETKDQGGEDFRLLQISNVGVGEFIETGKYRYVTLETFERLRCTEIVPDDLLVARMPTPIGRGWLATKMPWRMITAVDVAIIRADRTVVHPLFLAQAWNEASNLQRIAAQASGTTRLRITRRELAAMEFVVPTPEIQQQFADIVEPQGAMIGALRQQIQNLRRTRDLLLPRMLSGQIDVEAIAS